MQPHITKKVKSELRLPTANMSEIGFEADNNAKRALKSLCGRRFQYIVFWNAAGNRKKHVSEIDYCLLWPEFRRGNRPLTSSFDSFDFGVNKICPWQPGVNRSNLEAPITPAHHRNLSGRHTQSQERFPLAHKGFLFWTSWPEFGRHILDV